MFDDKASLQSRILFTFVHALKIFEHYFPYIPILLFLLYVNVIVFVF